MKSVRGWVPAVVLGVLVGTSPAPAADAPAEVRKSAEVTPDVISKIKDEGLKRSQLPATLSYLTDVIGPRLTGSPGLKRANNWTRDKLSEWGLQNAKLEPWGPFGRGWTLKRFSAIVNEPQTIPLIAFPYAWSPGTEGPVTAEVVLFDPKTTKDLEALKSKLKGKIVLSGNPREVAAHFKPEGIRLTETELLKMADAADPAPRTPGARRRRPNRAGAQSGGMDFIRKRAQFLADEGVVAVCTPSRNGDGGTLFVEQATVPQSAGRSWEDPARKNAWDKDAPKIPTQLVVTIEHFNRLTRILKAGEAVKMTLDLAVEFNDDDLMAYNTTAEIPGTDLKDEVVMLGGHLDSWHSGTGATDNAAGVSAAMEAMRILKALNLKPRRTIRVALWTGEEQGLYGSKAYVTQHFGEYPKDPVNDAVDALWITTHPRKLNVKPEYEKFCAYFNLDNGSGKIRGIHMEGNQAVRPIFRKWFEPFREMGAATLTPTPTGDTDHMSFDAIGLPGFQFIQDPLEYDSRTHHSNQDVYDRIQPDDLKQAAVVLATFAYQAAMSDEKLPRKPMPK